MLLAGKVSFGGKRGLLAGIIVFGGKNGFWREIMAELSVAN